MPTAQTSKSTNDKTKTRRPAKSKDVASETGERDENYNLISVLYHALQGAETAAKYQQDALKQGDEELAEFFDEARSGQAELASEAKRLLASRIEAGPDDDEDEDEGEADDEDDDD